MSFKNIIYERLKRRIFIALVLENSFDTKSYKMARVPKKKLLEILEECDGRSSPQQIESKRRRQSSDYDSDSRRLSRSEENDTKKNSNSMSASNVILYIKAFH